MCRTFVTSYTNIWKHSVKHRHSLTVKKTNAMAKENTKGKTGKSALFNYQREVIMFLNFKEYSLKEYIEMFRAFFKDQSTVLPFEYSIDRDYARTLGYIIMHVGGMTFLTIKDNGQFYVTEDDNITYSYNPSKNSEKIVTPRIDVNKFICPKTLKSEITHKVIVLKNRTHANTGNSITVMVKDKYDYTRSAYKNSPISNKYSSGVHKTLCIASRMTISEYYDESESTCIQSSINIWSDTLANCYSITLHENQEKSVGKIGMSTLHPKNTSRFTIADDIVQSLPDLSLSHLFSNEEIYFKLLLTLEPEACRLFELIHTESIALLNETINDCTPSERSPVLRDVIRNLSIKEEG